MRKLFLLVATVSLTLASCSNEEEIGSSINSKTGESIDFRTLMDKGTKAAITDEESLLSFTVTGIKMINATTPDTEAPYLFNAFGITKGEDKSWDYTPKRYWPAERTVDFYAYSPSSSKNVIEGLTNYVAGSSPITYKVPQIRKNDAQEDFLVARLTGQDESKGAVKLNFHHALSRIMFFAKTTQKNVTYTIEEVELLNLNTKGKLDLTDEKIQETGSLDYEHDAPIVIWDNPEDIENYKIDMGESPIYLLNDYKSILGQTGAILVMPQETTISSKGTGKEEPEYGEFAIKVSYKAFVDDIYYAGSPSTPAVKYFAVKAPGSTTDAITFEMGRQYNFFLAFGEDVGGKINFEVGVSDWDNNPGFEIYIPEIDNYFGKISNDLALLVDPTIDVNDPGTVIPADKVLGTDVLVTSTGDFDFTGLEYFTQLETLTIDGVTGAPNVDASKNQLLTSVTITNSELGSVNLSNGSLTALTLSGTNSIAILNASKNRLSNVNLGTDAISGNLNLSGNASLKTIDLTGVNINGTLNLSNCGFQDNGIVMSPDDTAANYTKITTLNLSSNMFTSLTFDRAVFTNLTISNNTLLTHLNILDVNVTGKIDAKDNAALEYINDYVRNVAATNRVTIKELDISDSRDIKAINAINNLTITTLVVWDNCNKAYIDSKISEYSGSGNGFVTNIKTANGTVLKPKP